MDDAAALFAAASDHHAAGRLRSAAELYKRIVTADPDHAAAVGRLGAIAHAVGQHGEAIRLLGRAVTLAPDDAGVMVNLGLAQFAAGRSAVAVECYRRAIELRPTLAEAHNNLGSALHALGRTDEAIASFHRAVDVRPDYAAARDNLARAVAPVPEGFDSAALDAALSDAERHAAAGRPADAAAAYRRATMAAPGAAVAWLNLSVASANGGDPDAAAVAAGRALALRPDDPALLNHLASVEKDRGNVSAAVRHYRRSLDVRDDPVVASNLAYALTFDPAASAADVLGAARRATPATSPGETRSVGTGRLRVGYVSPDFRDHVVGRNVLPLLRAHDRAQVEVFCYTSVAKPDGFTDECRAASDHWRDIAGQDDDAAAGTVRADRIDVLVDLTLHMAGNRLAIFARRHAPVQATFAGYPGTTGSAAIDYRLTDPYLDPPGTDGDYAERSVRLPHSFWCYDPAAMGVADEPTPDALQAVANGFVTFGCLNNFAKVNDAVLTAWAAVLDAVPGSRMVLLAPPGTARDRARRALGDRVAFVPFQSREGYLAVYRQIDIGLDTFPYNGHTTSLDGLWQGVPTVTLVGRTVVGRAGWSQLSNLGLTELAAATVPAFVATAVGLAGDLPRLWTLRRSLRDRMRQSPLCDATGFARGVEAAYRAMVGRR